MLNRARSALTLTFTALLLTTLSVPQAAFAGRSSGESEQHVKESVTFTLTPASCPDLAATVNGLGKREKEIHTRSIGGGAVFRVTDDVVEGLASDGRGQYPFYYKNHLEETVTPSGKILVRMTDSFSLVRGSTSDVKFLFAGTWSYTPPDYILTFGPDAVFTTFVGNAGCDPI